MTRLQGVDKLYRRVKKAERCAAEGAEGLPRHSKGCGKLCMEAGAPGARQWATACADGRPAPCLCADMRLPGGYVPDDQDWLGLDLRTCADHFTRDATSQAIRRRMECLPVVEEGRERRERQLMVAGLLTRTKDVVFGEGDAARSFWTEAMSAVYPFDREALKAAVKRAWEAGEDDGSRRRLLNAPLAGSAHYNSERKSPAADKANGRESVSGATGVHATSLSEPCRDPPVPGTGAWGGSQRGLALTRVTPITLPRSFACRTRRRTVPRGGAWPGARTTRRW